MSVMVNTGRLAGTNDVRSDDIPGSIESLIDKKKSSKKERAQQALLLKQEADSAYRRAKIILLALDESDGIKISPDIPKGLIKEAERKYQLVKALLE